MNALYITDWKIRYEVNHRNRAWKPGDKKFRLAPFSYYRSKVCGRAWGAGYRVFLKIAKGSAASSFGIFHKLVELAADGPPERRGFILDRSGVPLDADGLAAATGFRSRQIARAIEVLTDPRLTWISKVDYPGQSGKSGPIRANPGDSPISDQIRVIPDTYTEGVIVVSSLDKIETSYREVFQHDLPSTWTTAIKREAADGDGAVLDLIDAKAIRAGMKLAKDAGGTFGLGWVIRYLHDKAGVAVGAAKTKEHQAAAKAKADALEAQTDAERKVQLGRYMAYFRALPPSRQAEYRKQADWKGKVKRPEVVDAVAAVLAWRDKEAASAS